MPYLRQCGPPALVEAFPPIEDTIWLDGSGAKKYPCGRVALDSQRLISPGSTVAQRFGKSSSRMRFMRVMDTMTPPAGAIAPPMRPVPEPRGTTGTAALRQSRTTCATCSAELGSTTTSGVPL